MLAERCNLYKTQRRLRAVIFKRSCRRSKLLHMNKLLSNGKTDEVRASILWPGGPILENLEATMSECSNAFGHRGPGHVIMNRRQKFLQNHHST